MADWVVETPEGLTLRYELAGAGSRSAAALIDFALWSTATLAALFFFAGVLGGLGGLAVWVTAGTVLSLVGYQVAFAAWWGGKTPGKRVMGLSVVDENGLHAALHQHVLRSLFWPFEALLLVPIPLGVVLIAATSRRQRLGDRVAGTLVLLDSTRHLPAEPLARASWSELPTHRLELVPAHAARFGTEDVEFLRDLLGRTGVEHAVRARLLRRAAEHFADRLELSNEAGGGLERHDPRAFLSELYVFLREMRASSALTDRGA